MGLLDRLLGRGKQENPEDAAFRIGRSSTLDGFGKRIDVEHGGDSYGCKAEDSANGVFTVAYQYGRRIRGEPVSGRVYLFEDEKPRFYKELTRPQNCKVADNGTVTILDWLRREGLPAGELHIFDLEGEKILEYEFDSALGGNAITSDGRYVATATFSSDYSTYIFDLEDRRLITKRGNIGGNIQGLSFKDGDKGPVLMVSEEKRGDLYYGFITE